MSSDAPLISVLMGVLNCEKTLDESLSCLFAQTEDRWNLIICDDGSSDHTASVIQRWQDRYPEKIISLHNQQNKGLSYTLNRCLSEADGEFAARMDGDDLSSPDRFEKELRYLQEHPEYAVVSTDMQCFDAEGIWGIRAYPTDPGPADLVHGVPFCHAACMVRREALVKAGGYSESAAFERVEDDELWVRMYAMGCRGNNIHEPLYQMRDDRNAAARRKWKFRVNEARVRALAVKSLKRTFWEFVYALRPLVLGLLPRRFSSFLHHRKLERGLK